MKAFPLTVLDNFLDNPDQLRAFALSCDYQKSQTNAWPGLRSDDLYNLDYPLYRLLCLKIIALFADPTNVGFSALSNFQKIPKGSHASGWVHTDQGQSLTAILYLSPNGDMSTGTSLYRLNDLTYDEQYLKYKDFSKPEEKLEPYRIKNNQLFTETARVGGFYNRLVMFDSSEFHGANDYAIDDDDRLTLVIFFTNIDGYGHTPVNRSKRLYV